MPTRAAIVLIGNELLSGRTLDTNSHYLAQQLTQLGISVHRRYTIPDEPDDLRQALDRALGEAQLVFLTGGLGPTKDDLTKKVLADYFGLPLVEDPAVLAHLQKLFASRGREMTELNRHQALQPQGATILLNQVGTASGMGFEAPGGKEVYSFPGVPHEMRHLFGQLIPHLQGRYTHNHIRHHTLRTACMPESKLAALIEDIDDGLPPGLSLGYYPGLHAVDLRLNLYCPREHAQAGDAAFDAALAAIRQRLAKYIYAEELVSLSEAVGNLLEAQNATLATAESCTGGHLGAEIVRGPGSSAYYMGGIISYSNQVKIDQLGVSPEALEAHGAVSEQVALQLATGVRQAMGTTYGLSITGIAGPEGGSQAKPVGTVWIGLAGPEGALAKRFLFEKDRQRNIGRSVVSALELLRRALTGLTEPTAWEQAPSS